MDTKEQPYPRKSSRTAGSRVVSPLKGSAAVAGGSTMTLSHGRRDLPSLTTRTEILWANGIWENSKS
jgi:hypothetical protein